MAATSVSVWGLADRGTSRMLAYLRLRNTFTYLPTVSCIVLFAVVAASFCFVTLADEADMKAALALSGGSVKGGTLSIEVSKKRARDNKQDASSSRGGFTSPRGRGGGYQYGNNRGELMSSND